MTCAIKFAEENGNLGARAQRGRGRVSLTSPVSSEPKRSNFSTIDNGRLSMYKVDAGSQPECNAHRYYAPKRYEPLRAVHGCAQDS